MRIIDGDVLEKQFENFGTKRGDIICGSMLIKDAMDFTADSLTLDLVPAPVKCGECELNGHCLTEEVFKLVKLSEDKRFCGVAKRKDGVK